MNKKIAFFDTKPYDILFFQEMNKDFGFDIRFLESHLNKHTAKLAKGFDGVCAFVNDTIDKDVIDTLVSSGVKAVGLRCAGYNNVDFKAAYEKLHIMNVPAYSPYAVAEHAVSLILSLNRKIHKAYNRTRETNFSLNGLLGFDMHGKTVGIIGTGKIGRTLIQILKGFGVNIIAYDHSPDEKYATENNIEYVTLETLYNRSDIISLHCPLTPETEHLINEDAIKEMKEGVLIINTGRGKLVDTEALIAGLKNGKIGSAGLDVYEEESEYFFEDKSDKPIADDKLARLLTFPNVLVTSHQGFFTKEALQKIAFTTLNNFKEFFSGGYLENEICYKCNKPCIKKEKKRCFK